VSIFNYFIKLRIINHDFQTYELFFHVIFFSYFIFSTKCDLLLVKYLIISLRILDFKRSFKFIGFQWCFDVFFSFLSSTFGIIKTKNTLIFNFKDCGSGVQN
jgi:hypothetical protein